MIRTRILLELHLKIRLPVHPKALEDRFKWPFLKACESGLECLLRCYPVRLFIQDKCGSEEGSRLAVDDVEIF